MLLILKSQTYMNNGTWRPDLFPALYNSFSFNNVPWCKLIPYAVFQLAVGNAQLCVAEFHSRYFELYSDLMVTESNIYFSFVSCFQNVFSSGYGILFTLRISVYDALNFSRFVSILQQKRNKYRKRSYMIYFGTMNVSSLNMIYLVAFYSRLNFLCVPNIQRTEQTVQNVIFYLQFKH
jgi:hypothetical protein